jgi:hypothetical protein
LLSFASASLPCQPQQFYWLISLTIFAAATCQVGLVGCTSPNSLNGVSGFIGQISFISHNGLIGLIGLSLVSFKGLIGLISHISHIGFGFNGLSTASNMKSKQNFPNVACL